jgi:5-methyltetrahydrofolate--homocysteine methyltransferase
MPDFLQAVQDRVVVFDGAMGTQIHAADLSLDDYWGQEGNSEILNLSRPDLIRDIHTSYLAAGADAVETNAFGANPVVQAEYDMAGRAGELAFAAARIAREAVEAFPGRFVVGNLGPGTKSPTLGHITFRRLVESYEIQARALIEGGSDVLLIETCFDLLQAKAAVAACMDAFSVTGKKLPLMVQVTIETTGTMLLGTEITAALATLEPYPAVDVVGINCATGPVEMTEHVRALCRHSRRPVSVLPNAGLPELRDGKTFFPLTPEQLVDHHRIFVEEFGVSIVGGCCGTTPDYIRRLAEAVPGWTRARREPRHEPSCASLYINQPFKQDVSFFVIGERCNTTGFRKFKELVAAEDFDGCVEVASDQIREGAHALDVCVDFTGRDGTSDMREVVSRYRGQVTLPLFIDSTEPQVVECALELIGGRAVINSINLEEGTGPDTRLMHNLRLARRFGAAVVAGAIEEKGQATTAGWKLEVCRRLYDICLEHGLEAGDILFDPLALPISTGLEEARRYGLETLDAIARIKQELPGTFTLLGLSNISFGLSPAGRQVLNSVFLHEAVQRGLDAAIVSPARILPLGRLPDEQRAAALDLIYDRDPQALERYITLFEGVNVASGPERESLESLPLEERLKRRIIDGERKGVEADLDLALERWPALDIVNTFLLDGMKVVGDMFASGEMQLPFVLRSAETMKTSVAHLEPHMDKVGDGSKGRIVLATVKGDVHDIGKNLVDIILSNNGYTVFNLGIKQPIQAIVEAAENERCDAIGMSGLLVKSTLVMRENLDELNRRGLAHYPVLLGGAALTRGYVEGELSDLYDGSVFYGKDAFEGLRAMDGIMAVKRGEGPQEVEPKRRSRTIRKTATAFAPAPPGARSAVAPDAPVPTPPFLGSRVVKGIAVPEIARYLNRIALFRGQWQYRRRKGQTVQEYESFLTGEVEGTLRRWLAQCVEEQILTPAVVCGYFPAASDGNDLIVYREDGLTEWVRFSFPRQPEGRLLCISDFFRSVESRERDVVAFHLVTMGARVSEVARELFERNEYADYLHLHGLGVEMAEALAELWHMRIREELGFGAEDAGSAEELFDQKYRGSRYSFGYPACPNLEDQRQLFELLDPQRIGVSLSEEWQLDPEQSTSAIIVHHPEAKYFSIARI